MNGRSPEGTAGGLQAGDPEPARRDLPSHLVTRLRDLHQVEALLELVDELAEQAEQPQNRSKDLSEQAENLIRQVYALLLQADSLNADVTVQLEWAALIRKDAVRLQKRACSIASRS